MGTYTLTTNTSTSPESYRSSVASEEAIIFVHVSGDFDSGTLTIQSTVSSPADILAGNAVWISDSVLAFTAADVNRFAVHPHMAYRATLSGAGSPNLKVTFSPDGWVIE